MDGSLKSTDALKHFQLCLSNSRVTESTQSTLSFLIFLLCYSVSVPLSAVFSNTLAGGNDVERQQMIGGTVPRLLADALLIPGSHLSEK